MQTIKRKVRIVASIAIVATTAALALTGCSAAKPTKHVTITLSGPNQFTSDTNTFGTAWNKLIAGFEKDNPTITVKTNVLPISSWAQASSAQLTAGTAPELIFNQTPHKPNQIASLNSYLSKPNPFYTGADAKKPWIDDFKGSYFGGSNKLGQDASGHYEGIPFNLVAVGLYYNQNILSKYKISPSSLSSFDGFLSACSTLKKAGIAPVGSDNSGLYSGWTYIALQSMTQNDIAKEANQYDTSGNAGTATPVTAKSIAKAVLTGSVDVSKSPQIAAALQEMKKFYDACATPNWSGISSQGAFSGGTDFLSGKAALAWGTNFSYTALSGVNFKYATVPFPALSKSDTKYASGKPAQFGVNNGGTSYMIPAYIKGAQKAAAVKFLQYVSSPKVESWLVGTGGISALNDVNTPSRLAALANGAWAKLPPLGQSGGFLQLPAAKSSENEFEGYLLGSSSLSAATTQMQADSQAWAKEQVAQFKWTDSWAHN